MSTEIELTGLDGSNALAYMAALGTLRVLEMAWPAQGVRMSWRARASWLPVVHVDRPCGEDELIAALHSQLERMIGHPALAVDDDLKLAPERFRVFAQDMLEAFRDSGDRVGADFAAAFGCEATMDKECIQDTALRFGAGQQRFLKALRYLAEKTDESHLRRALLQEWAYEDPPPSMRWDPEDDRRYALRWKKPSDDQIRTVRGANRLAVEALPMLSTAPRGTRLETTGFRGRGSLDTFWTWPIWEPPLSCAVVRSVLSLAVLQQMEPGYEGDMDMQDGLRGALRRMGIIEVYRSQRLTIGKYRNFTPGRPV